MASRRHTCQRALVVQQKDFAVEKRKPRRPKIREAGPGRGRGREVGTEEERLREIDEWRKESQKEVGTWTNDRQAPDPKTKDEVGFWGSQGARRRLPMEGPATDPVTSTHAGVRSSPKRRAGVGAAAACLEISLRRGGGSPRPRRRLGARRVFKPAAAPRNSPWAQVILPRAAAPPRGPHAPRCRCHARTDATAAHASSIITAFATAPLRVNAVARRVLLHEFTLTLRWN